MIAVGNSFKNRVSALALLSGALFGLAIAPVSASDLSLKDTPLAGDKFELTGYSQLTTDYVFRGLSNNRRLPALQGGVDANYGIFYAGTFVSKVNFDGIAAGPANTHVEVDLYGGIKPKWRDLTFDFGIITYNYPRSREDHVNTFNPFYYEVKAGVSATVLKDVALSGTIYYSPDSQFEVGAATTLEGTISKPIYKLGDLDFTASGTFGVVFYEKSSTPGGPGVSVAQDDYRYWNVGLTTTWKEKISFDVRYWDSDAGTGVSPCSDGVKAFQCGSSVVGTAKVAF